MRHIIGLLRGIWVTRSRHLWESLSVNWDVQNTSIILFTILATVLVSWYGAVKTFDWQTEGGKIFDVLLLDTANISSFKTNYITESVYYIINWNDEKMANIDVFVNDIFVADVWMALGNSYETSSDVDFPLFLFPHNNNLRNSDALFLAYLNGHSHWEKTTTLHGPQRRGGFFGVVGFSEKRSLLGNARDVNFGVLPGSLNPLIESIISKGMIVAETDTEQEYLDALSERISQEFIQLFRLEEIKNTLGDSLLSVSFLYGRIQFVTLVLFFFCLCLLIISMFFDWARGAVESGMGLIPYVGFLGTLIGMGNAVGVLGDVNLSDPISKSLHLGSIGNNISVAIETTKYALVLYSVAVLLLLCRDACKRHQ